jgi:hypothetical protein
MAKQVKKIIYLIHNNKATGTTSILYSDNDEYIASRNGYNGNPGLVVHINNSSWQESGYQRTGLMHKLKILQETQLTPQHKETNG